MSVFRVLDWHQPSMNNQIEKYNEEEEEEEEKNEEVKGRA